MSTCDVMSTHFNFFLTHTCLPVINIMSGTYLPVLDIMSGTYLPAINITPGTLNGKRLREDDDDFSISNKRVEVDSEDDLGEVCYSFIYENNPSSCV
jgi:hypothetical protein